MQEPCPLSTCGVWKQDFKRSESLCPFMAGLFPWPLSSVACTVADYTPVTLRILCKSPNQIEIVDKTTFGRNVTEVRWPVPLFRFLVAKLSYLSLTGFFFPMTSFSLQTTLDGQEVKTSTRGGRKNFMLSGSAFNNVATIKCRLHQRGDGWETRQERFVDPSNPNVLIERNVLESPNQEPIVVTRIFNKTEEDVQSAYKACVQDLEIHQATENKNV